MHHGTGPASNQPDFQMTWAITAGSVSLGFMICVWPMQSCIELSNSTAACSQFVGKCPYLQAYKYYYPFLIPDNLKSSYVQLVFQTFV